MKDHLDGLTELLAVVEKGTFTAAAAALRITPSAVSQTIRALEQRIGVRLLQRTTRSVSLTEAGARFVTRLKPAIAGVHEAYDELGRHRDRPAGVLRLAIPRVAYEQVLGPRLPAFLAAYPDVEIDASIDDAFVDIVERGFDAGIRIGQLLDREMIGVRVSPDLRMAVVASPAYLTARGTPRHPRDLRSHECLLYRQRTSGAIYRWELVEKGKPLVVAVKGRVVMDDGDLFVDLALAGLGLAFVLEKRVGREIAEGRLVRLLEPFCPSFPGFHLYYPSRAQLAPKVKALADFFRVKTRRA